MGQVNYINTDTDAILRVDKRETGSSRFFNFIALGGSATRQAVSQIVGSWPPYWQLTGSQCIFNAAWQAHSCTKKADEDIARLDVRIPGYTRERDQALPPTPENYIGYLSQFGAPSRKMTVTINEGITGVTGTTGWYLRFDRGAPTTTEVWISQLPIQKYVILAMPYPAGTTFSIRRIFKWYGQLDTDVWQAGSLDAVRVDLDQQRALFDLRTPRPLLALRASLVRQVLNGDGLLYFFDGTYLYVKIVDPQYNSGNLVHEGLVVYGTRWWDLHYRIKTTNQGSGTFVSRSDPGPPPALSSRRGAAGDSNGDRDGVAVFEMSDSGGGSAEEGASAKASIVAEAGGDPLSIPATKYACDNYHYSGPSGSCEQVVGDGLCSSEYVRVGAYCREACGACW